MAWKSLKTQPCSPTELDSEDNQDIGSTPRDDPDGERSSDVMVLEPSGAISMATLKQTPVCVEPHIPLEDGCWEAAVVDFPPVPPQLSVQPEAIRPEDATEHSVPSLEDLREGK